MWICEKCGRVMDELESWREERGECFGFPAYETMWGCRCGSTDVFFLEEGILDNDIPENDILLDEILLDEYAEGEDDFRGREDAYEDLY